MIEDWRLKCVLEIPLLSRFFLKFSLHSEFFKNVQSQNRNNLHKTPQIWCPPKVLYDYKIYTTQHNRKNSGISHTNQERRREQHYPSKYIIFLFKLFLSLIVILMVFMYFDFVCFAFIMYIHCPESLYVVISSYTNTV